MNDNRPQTDAMKQRDRSHVTPAGAHRTRMPVIIVAALIVLAGVGLGVWLNPRQHPIPAVVAMVGGDRRGPLVDVRAAACGVGPRRRLTWATSIPCAGGLSWSSAVVRVVDMRVRTTAFSPNPCSPAGHGAHRHRRHRLLVR